MWLLIKINPINRSPFKLRKFLKEKGYDKYYVHGIGHFLGIDVHDVGDTPQPLQEGDVITLEPGIYILKKVSAFVSKMIIGW